ncbi:MAG TPA: hypothetical protein VFQ39_16345 [Longimicrobium sp.]|nr:hypothetical protein [Longimicrobium sp.]
MRQVAPPRSAPEARTPAFPSPRAFGSVPHAGTAADPVLAHDFSRVAVSAPDSGVVQRVIHIEGRKAKRKQLSKGRSKDEKRILKHWRKSNTVHDFTRPEHLDDALASAVGQPAEPPDLYGAGNLAFLTEADNRLPTLYFKEGNTSGRLRQQHGHGPKAASETNKRDYFFRKKKDLDKFHKAARKARRKGKKFDPWGIRWGFHKTPRHDDYHHEVTYRADDPRRVKTTHKSQGRVRTDLHGYDENAVRSIYRRIVGREH